MPRVESGVTYQFHNSTSVDLFAEARSLLVCLTKKSTDQKSVTSGFKSN